MFASRERIQRPSDSLRETDNVGPARVGQARPALIPGAQIAKPFHSKGMIKKTLHSPQLVPLVQCNRPGEPSYESTPPAPALRCEYLKILFKKMIDLRPSLIEHEQIVSPIAFTKIKKTRTTERTCSSKQFVCAEHLAIASSPEKSAGRQHIDYEPSTSDCLIVLPPNVIWLRSSD